MKQSDFTYRLNTKLMLHAQWAGLHFMWEEGESYLYVEGENIKESLFLTKPTNSCAKREMVKYVERYFNV